MEVLLSLIYVAFIILALIEEKRKYGCPSSPLYLVVVFNSAVLSLYYVTQDWLGFEHLIWRTPYIILRGCFFFSLVSLFFTHLNTSNTKYKQLQLNFVRETPGRKMLILAFITVVFMTIRIFAYGVSNILEDEDTASSFGGNGLGGHVLVLQIFLTTHILGRKFELRNLFVIAPLFLCLFLYNVKAWIIIPLLIGWFIHRDLRKVTINPLWYIVIPVLIFAIFTISYMLTLGFDIDNMSFIWAHFCKYIYAGIGGLNVALRDHYPIGTTPTAGLPSFISLIFGLNSRTPSVYDNIVINYETTEWTNVLSLFGTTYLINGSFVGILYIISLAIISYVLYNKRLNTNNYWFYLAYYLWASGLILSFFSNYYKLLNIWEMTTYSFIIGWWYKNIKRTEVK